MYCRSKQDKCPDKEEHCRAEEEKCRVRKEHCPLQDERGRLRVRLYLGLNLMGVDTLLAAFYSFFSAPAGVPTLPNHPRSAPRQCLFRPAANVQQDIYVLPNTGI